MFPKRSKGASDEPLRRRRSAEDESTPTSGSQFKRNQTLSSYRHNTPEESSRQKVHSLASQRRRLGGVFAIVSIVTLLLAFLLWQLIAQVHVTTSSKQLTSQFSSELYEEKVHEYFGVKPAQRLRLSLDETSLSAYVSRALPEVEALELSGMPGIAQSNFVITFRTPVAGWQMNGNQYYVDANGVVFSENYYEEPKVQIIDESGIRPEQGSAVIGGRMLGFLGKVVAQAQGRGYTVERAVLPANMTRELDIYLAGISTRIKLSVDRGAGEQIEDMDRSLKYLQARVVTPEYIDVRVSGRAAYQ